MRLSTILRYAGIALALLCSVGAANRADSTPAPASVRLVLSGSTTMAPLMAAIAHRYRQSHPEVLIEVRMGGSGQGVSDVRAGRVDLGMVSRPLQDGEGDLDHVAIARDGVAVIVHRDNPVQSLDDAQLARVYLGAVRDWRDAGGGAGPIHVLAGTAEAGSSSLFASHLGIPFEKFKTMRKHGPNAERIAAVAADPLAIVYLSVGEAERAARNGSPIRLLAIGGIAARSAEVRAGRYPIARPLLLVRRAPARAAATQFVEYCMSQQVNDPLVAFDFVAYQD